MPPTGSSRVLAGAQRPVCGRGRASCFGLPEGESTELELVTGEHWSAYNYYLGDLKSRVAVNTDVPPNALSIALPHRPRALPGPSHRARVEGAAALRGQAPAGGGRDHVRHAAVGDRRGPRRARDRDGGRGPGRVHRRGARRVGNRLRRGARERGSTGLADRSNAWPNNAALLLHEDGVSAEESEGVRPALVARLGEAGAADDRLRRGSDRAARTSRPTRTDTTSAATG